MSWETLSETNEPCPCGNGTYTIIREADDWNRLEESWVMNCPQCKENYKLEVKHIIDRDGIDDKVMAWGPK